MCSQLYGGEAPGARADKGDAAEGGLLANASLQDGEEAFSGGAPRDPRSSVGAFTIFQLVQNGGSALWYLVNLQMPLHDTTGASPPLPPGSLNQVWLQCGLLALVAVTFVTVDRMNLGQ